MKGTVPPVGQVFERLTVLGYGARQYHWLCQCSCGKIKEINKFHIGKNIKSCGCLLKEWVEDGQKKHGKRRTLTYEVWAALKQRCLNPRCKDYKYYGGRGIKLCKDWMDFGIFLADMGEKPGNHSIERIDTNGDYCKSNCMWIKKSLQNRNKRNNKKLTFMDKTQTAIEWAEQSGIAYGTLQARLRYGWTVEDALSIPVKRRH